MNFICKRPIKIMIHILYIQPRSLLNDHKDVSHGHMAYSISTFHCTPEEDKVTTKVRVNKLDQLNKLTT